MISNRRKVHGFNKSWSRKKYIHSSQTSETQDTRMEIRSSSQSLDFYNPRSSIWYGIPRKKRGEKQGGGRTHLASFK